MFMSGRFEEALTAIRGEFDREANKFASFSYGQTLVHAGHWEELEALVGKLRTDFDSAPLYKLIVAQDRERALPLLRDAVARGFWNHRFLGEHDPLVSQLRGDPRFDQLMELAQAEAQRL